MTILTILRTSVANIQQPFYRQFYNVRALVRMPSNVMACYDDPNRKCDDDDEIDLAPGKSEPKPQHSATGEPGMSSLGHRMLPSNVMACYDDPNRKCDDDDEIDLLPGNGQPQAKKGSASEPGASPQGYHTLSAHATTLVAQLTRALGLDGLQSSALQPVGV